MADKVIVQQSSGGVGFLGLLALVFITLKLCGVIAWSWWWVLAPLWIPFFLCVGIFTIILLVMIGAVIMAACCK